MYRFRLGKNVYYPDCCLFIFASVFRKLYIKRIFIFSIAVVLLSGCASDGYRDYDRHAMSLMRMSDEGDTWLFDARTDANYPANSLNAEAMRMRWAGEWLRQRKSCDYGFDVVSRRQYQPGDDNPLRWNLRYELACKDPPADG